MIVALAGGVGGAKLAEGLAGLIGSKLTVIVNTADDFEHLGLPISPDLDTVMYTLAGIANRETGWGIAGETWSFLDQVVRLGGPSWFRLGDRDLATHALRAVALRSGQNLTTATADLCRRLGIAARVLPMSDDAVRTIVHTAEGDLPFQEYFVARKCDVAVSGFEFAGVERARPTEAVIEALRDDKLEAIVFCPSNPFVSIDPILSLPGLRALIVDAGVPVVAVSPIIAGAAVKGPAAKMMRELGLAPTPVTVARHYRGVVTGFVMDKADASFSALVEAQGMAVRVTDALMRDEADRRRLAQQCLDFARSLA
ncbi:MAG TPA: 2-phospho-L-lactate transferase [Stellaceae bacterium]|nr:2-phospho-L-lactate transferase [Stellaceae bacterium]